jgi:hypothetical protein
MIPKDKKKLKTRIGKQCCRTVLPRKVNAEQNEESQLQKPEKQMEQNTRGRRIWKTKRNSTACHKILQREMDRQTDSKSEAKLNLATHRSSTGTKKMGKKNQFGTQRRYEPGEHKLREAGDKEANF